MNAFTVTKHGHSRFWAVRDPAGELVCLCVYKRGAVEVARRLSLTGPSSPYCLREDSSENSREAVRKLPDASRAHE